MEPYINSFVHGREILKKLLISDLVTAVLAVLLRSNPALMGTFSIATILLFVAVIYFEVKYCRCPNCGKVIVVGVLAVNTCPRCKRSLITGKKAKKR